jgi:hypothetical protein
MLCSLGKVYKLYSIQPPQHGTINANNDAIISCKRMNRRPPSISGYIEHNLQLSGPSSIERRRLEIPKRGSTNRCKKDHEDGVNEADNEVIGLNCTKTAVEAGKKRCRPRKAYSISTESSPRILPCDFSPDVGFFFVTSSPLFSHHHGGNHNRTDNDDLHENGNDEKNHLRYHYRLIVPHFM